MGFNAAIYWLAATIALLRSSGPATRPIVVECAIEAVEEGKNQRRKGGCEPLDVDYCG